VLALLAVVALADPVPPPACDQQLAALASHWRAWQTAADPSGPRQAFTDGWRAVPAECRTGDWYLLAARQLAVAAGPLQAGDVALASTKEALERGLAIEPDDPELLAYLAFGSALVPDAFPALPDDACDRVRDRPGDDASYVCGMLALRQGRFDDASDAFDAIAHLYEYPDGAIRRAEAHRGAGRKGRHAKTDREQRAYACARFGAPPGWCDRLPRR
jgi:hypothetical protein